MNTDHDIGDAPLHAEAVLDAMPVGVAVVDAAQRIVLFNPAYCASLDLPPNSFPPGTPVADALRASAYRGVYGPGDPEAQVAAIPRDRPLARRPAAPAHLQRPQLRHAQAPLPDGGYVVCAVETTALVAARAEAETALARDQHGAGHACAPGSPHSAPTGALLFANPRFAELFGLPPDQLRPASDFSALLDLMAARDEFAGADGAAFIAAQRAHRPLASLGDAAASAATAR